jgi:hypothetical protein
MLHCRETPVTDDGPGRTWENGLTLTFLNVPSRAEGRSSEGMVLISFTIPFSVLRR